MYKYVIALDSIPPLASVLEKASSYRYSPCGERPTRTVDDRVVRSKIGFLLFPFAIYLRTFIAHKMRG